MPDHQDLIKNLTTLNQIIETLNRAMDVRSALDFALTRLVELMNLETGWIFLKDPASQNRWAGKGYVLAAYHNLPEALKPNRARPWKGSCDCQTLCNKGDLTAAYNAVRCSRLANAPGDRAALVVHASAPLRSGNQGLGILNVAATDWDSFSPEALVLLANVGSQMGIALERARLYDMLREQRIHEQAALLELSNQLLSRHRLDDLIAYLVDAVRDLLQVDACAIALVEKNTRALVFHAASGWQTDPVNARRILPADQRTGSGVSMSTLEPLLIEDMTTNDPTPWTAHWFREEGFRGQAVVPLITDGHSIGTLIINTRQPHTFDEDEVRFLRLMANQAAIAIEKARLQEEELRHHRLEEELAVGREIQRSLLPAQNPVAIGWEFATAYCPARLVGGDFYDFFCLSDTELGLVIADVADKGVPAALLMALSRTVIRTVAVNRREPRAVLQRANTLILSDSRAHLFVTAFYAALDIKTGQLTYSNAGHNWPIHWNVATQQCHELSARGVVLGILPDIALEQHTITLGIDDVVVFYTDGITEAMNAGEELFGDARLHAVIEANTRYNAQTIVDAIVQAVDDFVDGIPQSDDFTLVVVKRVRSAVNL